MRSVLARGVARLASPVLHDRRLARSPLLLYRAGLGRLLGSRLLVLEHRGRRSGLLRQVVLEVVDRPAPRTFRVVSGLGPSAQWYRNLLHDPRCRVSTGRVREATATAYPVPREIVGEALTRYAAEHPRAWEVLEQVIRPHLPAGDTYEDFLPMVDLVLDEPGSPVMPR